MIYRKLGRTGVDVGIIGLGAEHLEHAPVETVDSVVNEAMEGGVNYIDLFMASPGVRSNFGTVLKGRRDKVMIAGHIGSCFKDGQYYRTRDRELCDYFVNDLLTRLQSDYIDVLMLHFIDEMDDYETVFSPGGLLDTALRLKKEGKARFIGLSSHKVPVSLRAVNSGYIDALMFPVNPAFDTLPGDTELEALWKEESYIRTSSSEYQPTDSRKELYHACSRQGVGIIAMKPYAAGLLFSPHSPNTMPMTPVQCLSYALSQPGVCSVVPGCKTADEMKAALAYLNAAEQEKDFSFLSSSPRFSLKGSCMYCNHCLPCPMEIDIAAVTRAADAAFHGVTDILTAQYRTLEAAGSACIKCEACMERCPFGVDVIGNMERAVKIFGI